MVTQKPIQRIRHYIRNRQYDMTAHAVEEMAEDNLDFDDVEHAVLSGRIVHSDFEDPRGPKHVIHGLATDAQVPVGVVGRFAKADRFLIITVFEVTD